MGSKGRQSVVSSYTSLGTQENADVHEIGDSYVKMVDRFKHILA